MLGSSRRQSLGVALFRDIKLEVCEYYYDATRAYSMSLITNSTHKTWARIKYKAFFPPLSLIFFSRAQNLLFVIIISNEYISLSKTYICNEILENLSLDSIQTNARHVHCYRLFRNSPGSS